MIPIFKSVRIQNLLSFGPDSPELELKPINILIGPNGCGKSNFLAALSLLCSERKIYEQIEQHGGLDQWFWKGNEKYSFKTIFTFNCNIVPDLSIEISVGKNASKSTKIIGFSYSSQNKQFDIALLEKKFSAFLENKGKDQNIIFNWPDCSLDSSVFLFRDWQFGPSVPVRKPQIASQSNERLNQDGSNLPHILKRIQENEESKNVFLNFFRELYENADELIVEEIKGHLFFSIQEGEQQISSYRISDGTLRYLALLAILCDPSPPPMVCLEEPEMGLHPDLIRTVADAIQYASERTQVVATTHSVSLVDKFTDSPESIVVCEKIDGSTEMKRLDPEELKPWLEEYRLGELWTSGEIGGNRW